MRRIHAKCGDGECDQDDCVGAQEIIKTREDFDPSRDERRTKETNRRAIRRYTAPGADLPSDCPGLRDREKPELYQTRGSREARRN